MVVMLGAIWCADARRQATRKREKPLWSSCHSGQGALSGTPKDIVDVLSRSIKKAMANEGFKKKHDEMWMTLRYLDAAQYATMWEKVESDLKPIFDEVRKR